MFKAVFIFLLIANGASHLFDVSNHRYVSWLFGDAQALAWALAVTAAAFLILAGAGLWMTEGWWRVAAVIGTTAALLRMSTFFVGINVAPLAVNLVALIAIVAFSWPSVDSVGA